MTSNAAEQEHDPAVDPKTERNERLMYPNGELLQDLKGAQMMLRRLEMKRKDLAEMAEHGEISGPVGL